MDDEKHSFSPMLTGKLQLCEIEEDHWKKEMDHPVSPSPTSNGFRGLL